MAGLNKSTTKGAVKEKGLNKKFFSWIVGRI